MKIKLHVTLLGLAFALSFVGCATGPTQQDIAAADYGSIPMPASYESAIKAAFELTLKDPSSAQYKFSQPYKAWLHTQGILAGDQKGTVYGYTVPVLVNAKNSYGGYNGYEPYKFFFAHGEKLIAFIKIDGTGFESWQRID